MPAITSHQDYKRITRQVRMLGQFRRRAEQMLDLYELEEKVLLLSNIDARVRDMKADLNDYAALQQIEPVSALLNIQDLAQKLIHTRIWLGWSQRKLGLRAGISGKSINDYERRRYLRTNLETLLLIADALQQGLRDKAEVKQRWRSRPSLSEEEERDVYKKTALAYDEDAEFMIVDGQLVEPPHEPDAMDDFSTGL